MNVLFLMISYPDVRQQNKSLYSDLVDEFARNGNNVYVVAPVLNKRKESMEIEGLATVLRIKTPELFNTNPIMKGIANLMLPLIFRKAIRRSLKNIHFDLVITPTPPITFVSVVKWLKKGFGAKFYLILRDIFPQNAKDLGLVHNNFVYNFFRKKEIDLYKTADKIGCMSQGNINFIKLHNPNIEVGKLHLLPNWETPTPYSIPSLEMKKKYGFEGKYIAVFGGNIGRPQQLEFVLELAERKKTNENIVFLIIGNGTERQRIENIAKEKDLSNIVFKNMISRDDYNELLKECEVGLICLNEKFTIPNIPSKTLSYFNAKIPVLAAVDKNTDYGQLLEDSESGFWSITGDVDAYERNFDLLYNDEALRNKMGENGNKYLNKYLTSEIAYKTILLNIN